MRVGCGAAFLGLLLLLSPSMARADGGHASAVEVTAVGACPARDAVLVALAPVVRPAADGRAGAARVVDQGDRFDVSAAGQRAQYSDPARDCGERARIAAVFIALALNPPVLAPAAAPPHVAPPPSAEVAAAPAPTVASPAAAWWWAVGAGARLDATTAGHQPSSTVVTPGAEVRAALGRGAVGLFAVAGALGPSRARFDALSVRQTRFPLSLGATARVGAPGTWQVTGDLGVALSLFSVRAQGLASASTETRLDVGARLAVGVRAPAVAGGHVVPFIELHSEFYPWPYTLEVEPLGDIGKTSRLWVGASAGAWFDLR